MVPVFLDCFAALLLIHFPDFLLYCFFFVYLLFSLLYAFLFCFWWKTQGCPKICKPQVLSHLKIFLITVQDWSGENILSISVCWLSWNMRNSEPLVCLLRGKKQHTLIFSIFQTINIGNGCKQKETERLSPSPPPNNKHNNPAPSAKYRSEPLHTLTGPAEGLPGQQIH